MTWAALSCFWLGTSRFQKAARVADILFAGGTVLFGRPDRSAAGLPDAFLKESKLALAKRARLQGKSRIMIGTDILSARSAIA